MAAATAKGTTSSTWLMVRSSTEPSIQNVISIAANGLDERFNASEIAAPESVPMAMPPRMSVSVPSDSRISPIKSSIATMAVAMANSGSAHCDSAA